MELLVNGAGGGGGGGGSAHARSAQTVNAYVLFFCCFIFTFNSSFWVFVNYVLKLNNVI